MLVQINEFHNIYNTNNNLLTAININLDLYCYINKNLLKREIFRKTPKYLTNEKENK